MANLCCERSIFDTTKGAAKTALIWGVAGGVLVPWLMSTYQVGSDEASAALAVFLGSLMLVLNALFVWLKRLAADAPPEESKPQELTPKMWVLVALSLFTVLAATVALSTSISYVAFSQFPIAWAQSIAYWWSLGLWAAAFTSFLLVPIVLGVYVAMQHLDGWWVSVLARIHSLCMITAVLLVSQLGVLSSNSLSHPRHHLSRHA